MYPDTPAGRKRTVALLFGAVGDLKATHTIPGAGDKARVPGDSTLRYVRSFFDRTKTF